MITNHSLFLKTRHGFTLIELLVVLAIMIAMLAVAIPSFSRYEENANLKAKADEFAAAINQTAVLALNPEQAIVTSSSPYYYIHISTLGRAIQIYRGTVLSQSIPFGSSISTVTSANSELKINAGKNYVCLMTVNPATNPCGEGTVGGATYVNSGPYMTITGVNGIAKTINIHSNPVQAIVQ